VPFNHFYGVSPKRYRDLFERGRRKDKAGKFRATVVAPAEPNIEIRFPVYLYLEKDLVFETVLAPSLAKAGTNLGILADI
jgi:hypothetical protein